MSYFTVSNVLSLCRAPLAIVFLTDNVWVRMVVLILGGISDYLDGFLARRFGSATPLGAVLDPLMDKFFMFFITGVLVFEHKLGGWAATGLLTRDLLLGVFGLYLTLMGTWHVALFRSIWWGKVATIGQYVVFAAVVSAIALPTWVFFVFPALGLLYFTELLLSYRQLS